MPTRAKAKTADEVVEDVAVVADETKEVESEASAPSTAKAAKKSVTTKKNDATNAKELDDKEEIEVVALIPNVSYYDKATGDRYEWENAGDVEYMTVEAIQRMRRNSRGYFEDMCVKPNDERVIKKFGMERYYEQHDYLMDASNYTKDNIANVLDKFSSLRSNSLKSSIVNKIKDMIANGELSDAVVIRAIEKRLDIDLISLL
jgi:hypothetical protein